MVLGLGAQGRGVRVGQEPADADQGALGGALLAGDDEEGMRPDRPQRGRDPGDQEWKVIGIDIHVIFQKCQRAVTRGRGDRELTLRTAKVNVGPRHNLPARGLDFDGPPRRIAEVEEI